MTRKIPPLVLTKPDKGKDKCPQIRTRRDIYLKVKEISERANLPLREVVDRLLEFSFPYVEF